MKIIKTIGRQILTGHDNATHDLGRWSWLISLAAIIGGAVANAFHGAELHLRELGEALGIVSGAHGAAIWAKKDTEPDRAGNIDAE